MKAKANATGYYDGVLRYAGDVFDVPDGESALWFEPFETSGASQDPPDNDPLGIHELTDTPPEEAPPETGNKPRKPDKQENLK